MVKLNAVVNKLSPDLKKIISNTGWLFADKILQMGLALVVGVWVARYLGPQQFGLFNYAASFVGMFSPLVNMGLNSIVVRDITRNPLQKNETLGTAFGLSFFGGILSLLLSIGFIYLLEPGESLTHLLVGIFALGSLLEAFNTIDLWFQSQLQSKQTVLAKKTAYILMCVVRVWLIQVQAPITSFALTRLVEIVLSNLAIITVYKVKGNLITSWRFNLKRAKELLREGFPLVISGAAVYVYAKIDQIMLGNFLADKSQLGFYSAAVRVAEIFDFLPMIIASSLLPKLTQMKDEGSNYKKQIQIYFDMMILMWLIVAIPVSIFAPQIVLLLYGESYAPTASLLAIYIWGQFSANLCVARSTYLTIENKLHYTLYISFIGALINITLNLFLIPKYQALGATITTIITYFTVAIPVNYLFSDLKPISNFIFKAFNINKSIKRILNMIK